MKKLFVLASAFFIYASASAQTTPKTSTKPTSEPVKVESKDKNKGLTEGPKVKSEKTQTKGSVTGVKENDDVKGTNPKGTNPSAGKPNNGAPQKSDKVIPVKKDKGLNSPEPKPKQPSNK
jgi:hypothetical protein